MMCCTAKLQIISNYGHDINNHYFRFLFNVLVQNSHKALNKTLLDLMNHSTTLHLTTIPAVFCAKPNIIFGMSTKIRVCLSISLLPAWARKVPPSAF